VQLPPFATDGKILIFAAGLYNFPSALDSIVDPVPMTPTRLEAVAKVLGEMPTEGYVRCTIPPPETMVCPACDGRRWYSEMECDVCDGIGHLCSEALRKSFTCPACSGTEVISITPRVCGRCSGSGRALRVIRWDSRASRDHVRVARHYTALVGDAEWAKDPNPAEHRVWWRSKDSFGVLYAINSDEGHMVDEQWSNDLREDM